MKIILLFKKVQAIAMYKFVLRLILLIAVLLFVPAATLNGPLADGGAFPTSTPTQPPPTHPPTNTPETTPIPTGTNTPSPAGGESDAASRLEAFEFSATATIIPTALPEESGSNPLMPVVYVGLFIFMVVGVWMLFSRSNRGP